MTFRVVEEEGEKEVKGDIVEGPTNPRIEVKINPEEGTNVYTASPPGKNRRRENPGV